MSRILICVLIVVVAALTVAPLLQAQAEPAPQAQPIWVGVTAWLTKKDQNDYLVGTIENNIFNEIESGKYDRKFLKISDLRIESQETLGLDSDETIFVQCADKYDKGDILIRYEDVLSIELKKGDPLKLQ